MPRRCDTEAERSVIAGLLQDPKRLVELKGFERLWFTLPECRRVIDAANRHHRESLIVGKVRYATRKSIEKIVDADLSKPVSDKAQSKKRAALLQSVRTLLDDAESSDPVSDHEFREAVDDVRTAALDEAARKAVLELADKYESSGAKGILRDVQQLALTLNPQVDQRVEPISRSVSRALAEYEAAKANPGSGRIATPHPHLNKITGGGKLGRFWGVCAYAKDGKTMVAKDLVYHAAAEEGKTALIVTREQTRADIENMLIVRHSHKFHPGGISYDRFNNGMLDRAQEAAMRQTVADIEAGGLGDLTTWQPHGGTTVSDIRQYAEHLSRRKPIDVMMVDHTGLFSPTRRSGSDRGDASEVFRELKQTALEMNDGRGVWLIACHQINRNGYEEALKRGYYLPGDMAETGEAERSLDVFVWLLRTEEMKDVREARMGIGLNRWGGTEVKGWDVVERFDAAAILPMEGT